MRETVLVFTVFVTLLLTPASAEFNSSVPEVKELSSLVKDGFQMTAKGFKELMTKNKQQDDKIKWLEKLMKSSYKSTNPNGNSGASNSGNIQDIRDNVQELYVLFGDKLSKGNMSMSVNSTSMIRQNKKSPTKETITEYKKTHNTTKDSTNHVFSADKIANEKAAKSTKMTSTQQIIVKDQTVDASTSRLYVTKSENLEETLATLKPLESKISKEILEKNYYCSEQKTADTIHTPNYPHTYPSNTECRWNIEVPKDRFLVITFTSFNLENSFQCLGDFVTIHDSKGEQFARLCGYKTGPLVYKIRNTDPILLRFMSDSLIGKPGFELHYETKSISGWNLFVTGNLDVTQTYNDLHPFRVVTEKLLPVEDTKLNVDSNNMLKKTVRPITKQPKVREAYPETTASNNKGDDTLPVQDDLYHDIKQRGDDLFDDFTQSNTDEKISVDFWENLDE